MHAVEMLEKEPMKISYRTLWHAKNAAVNKAAENFSMKDDPNKACVYACGVETGFRAAIDYLVKLGAIDRSDD